MIYNIICVHVGNKYSSDYVEKLYRACVRNCSKEFLFTVLHDGKSYSFGNNNVKLVTVENMNYLRSDNLWWYKMQAFRPDVAIGKYNMLIDLDVVIVNNIDKLWDYAPENFCIIQDFNRHWVPNYVRSNSSVVKFNQDMASYVYNSFLHNYQHSVTRFRGDQDWMDEYINQKKWWPSEWIKSWKWEVYNGGLKKAHSDDYYDNKTALSKDCSILVFHGKPDPHEVDDTIVIKNWY